MEEVKIETVPRPLETARTRWQQAGKTLTQGAKMASGLTSTLEGARVMADIDGRGGFDPAARMARATADGLADNIFGQRVPIQVRMWENMYGGSSANPFASYTGSYPGLNYGI